MDPTEQHRPSTDALLEAVFIRYIRSGTAGAGAGTGSEPGRCVVEMARRAGSEYKDRFEALYGSLAVAGGVGRTKANASAVSSDEFVASCIAGDDGQCNWGRVATSLAFSRLVAEKLVADGELIDAYSDSVGKSLARFVREWKSRDGQDLDLQTPIGRVSSSKRWTADAFVSCFGAFVKVGTFAVNCANEAIR